MVHPMKIVVLSVLMVLIPSAAQSQVRVICQTPQFWCVFYNQFALPDGTGCHCGTPRGPIFGYSIVDMGPPRTMPMPQPIPPQTPQPMPPQRPGPTGNASNDCYRGLGNCPGTYE